MLGHSQLNSEAMTPRTPTRVCWSVRAHGVRWMVWGVSEEPSCGLLPRDPAKLRWVSSVVGGERDKRGLVRSRVRSRLFTTRDRGEPTRSNIDASIRRMLHHYLFDTPLGFPFGFDVASGYHRPEYVFCRQIDERSRLVRGVSSILRRVDEGLTNAYRCMNCYQPIARSVKRRYIPESRFRVS